MPPARARGNYQGANSCQMSTHSQSVPYRGRPPAFISLIIRSTPGPRSHPTYNTTICGSRSTSPHSWAATDLTYETTSTYRNLRLRCLSSSPPRSPRMRSSPPINTSPLYCTHG